MSKSVRPIWIDKLKSEPLEVLGYHGTSATRAQQIMHEGFRISRNDWDWLGEGVYFWQDAPLRALEWARTWPGAKGGGGRAVIRARLRLAGCMDLLDNDWNELLRQGAATFAEALAQDGRQTPSNNKPYGCNRLDRAYFDFIVGRLRRGSVLIRSIRTAVTEGAPVQSDSPICFDSHVQIAIRDPSLISDIKLIYTE